LEEGGEEERSARSQVDRRSHDAAAIDVEIDPQGRLFSRCQTNFALQAIVKRRASIAKRVAVMVALWHSNSGEVRVGLAMGL